MNTFKVVVINVNSRKIEIKNVVASCILDAINYYNSDSSYNVTIPPIVWKDELDMKESL